MVWSYIGQRLAFEVRRPFKRALFWYASGGRDLDRFDPFHLSFRRTAGRRVVSEALFSASSNTAVILGLGQSNIANEGDASALYEPKGEVYNFNFFDGKCYVGGILFWARASIGATFSPGSGELLTERKDIYQLCLAGADRAWRNLRPRMGAGRQDVSKAGVESRAFEEAPSG